MGYQVSKRFTFCYAHRLMQHPGKCRHLHGHNATVEVFVSGDLGADGMVADFGEIKATIGAWVDTWLDHAALLHQDDPLVVVLKNERVFAMREHPTAEAIAGLIGGEALKLGLAVSRVDVHETETSVASWTPELHR
jgi:6-pyruvoyltetrahydropterin/6-carboxytetrahydropterin synthase